MKREFYYPSQDGETNIHGVEWIPEGEIKAILQISHGMVEYIDRYDGFASWLAGKGWYVTGNDHLGHGQSVVSEDRYGFFHEKDGNKCVIGDIHTLRKRTQEKYPGVPYFVLGHSMGSFLIRQYISQYGEGLSGAIIMGTGHKGVFLLDAGRILCRLVAACKGWNYRSTFINNLGMGSYQKSFPSEKSANNWITSDKERRDKYEKDPLCSFIFTVNGYEQMFAGMRTMIKRKNLKRIPKNLPIFFVAGAQDPVGNSGKDVEKVFHSYQKLGIKNCSIKLYPNARHELLNERNRKQVYGDLYRWMTEQTAKTR